MLLVRHVPEDEAHVSQGLPVAGGGGQPNAYVVPLDKLQEVLDKYKDTFQSELPGLPPWRDLPPVIPLEPGARPANRPMFRYSQAELAEMQRQLQDLLAKGLVRPSCSPFGAPVLFVKKKDGSLRMCCDYRALNKATIKNAFPLPRIDDLLDKLGGAKLFSSMDLTNAYMQFRLCEEECERTAFKTPFGLYEFRVIPFGVTNAPQAFSAALSKIFQGFLGKFCCCTWMIS